MLRSSGAGGAGAQAVDQIVEEAMAFFATKEPEIINPYYTENLPQESFANDYDLLAHLLNPGAGESKQGVCIGEAHRDSYSKQVLIDNMYKLRQAGIEVIYLEHLFADQHQALLEQYFSSDSLELPKALAAYLADLDRDHLCDDEKYNFTQLVISAKKAGIQIVAIDHSELYKVGGDGLHVRDSHLRISGLNYHAYREIMAAQAKKTHKYIVFVGSGHVGIDYDDMMRPILGTDNLLQIPSMVFLPGHQAEDRREVTTPQNFNYALARGHYVIDRDLTGNSSLSEPEKTILSVIKIPCQSNNIKSLFSACHLTGVMVRQLRTEAGLSFEHVVEQAAIRSIDKNSYLGILERSEQLIDGTDYLKISIELTRELLPLLPRFFEHVKVMPISSLVVRGQIPITVVLELLTAVKENEHVESIRFRIDTHAKDAMVQCMKDFMSETKGRILLALDCERTVVMELRQFGLSQLLDSVASQCSDEANADIRKLREEIDALKMPEDFDSLDYDTFEQQAISVKHKIDSLRPISEARSSAAVVMQELSKEPQEQAAEYPHPSHGGASAAVGDITGNVPSVRGTRGNFFSYIIDRVCAASTDRCGARREPPRRARP